MKYFLEVSKQTKRSTQHPGLPFSKTLCCVVISGLLFACQQAADAPTRQIEVANAGVNAGRFSAKGEYALVGSLYHGLSLWRIADQERLFDWRHQENQSTVLIDADFSQSTAWAVSADVSTLVLWNTENGTGERYWHAPGEILSIALSANAKFALLGLSDHTAVLFDIRKGGVVRTLHHNNRVRSVDLSVDGKYALTGSEDYQATFWDLETGVAVSKMQHKDDVQLVKLSDDGTLAFSVSKYDRAVLWSTVDGRTQGELPLRAQAIKRGLKFTTARFSADNQWLLTGRPDQIISLWQVDALQEVKRWKIPKRKAWKPQGAAIIDVAFTDTDQVFLALSSNGFISFLAR